MADLPEILLGGDTPFIAPLTPKDSVEITRKGEFTFLNRTETVGWPPAWNVPSLPRLWIYNLHYHDFLWALPYEDGLVAARDWIQQHPLGNGQVGWEPYPTSLRLQNWCMYFFGAHRDRLLSDGGVVNDLWGSIFHQVSWLERHFERHILGNHLVENAGAMAFVGATFGGALGSRWLRTGLALLKDQLPELVLTDGGHAERSPMYHARLCQMLENLVRTGNTTLVELVEPYLRRSQRALGLLCHPDGDIALLNDAAFGIYPGISELDIDRAQPGSFELPVSGYFGAQTQEQHYVVCDAGPIGLDYQPGHAHGDTFSFELSFGATRFVVDSGVYNYEPDEWREYARSTRAHNTVELNRLDQSEFWDSFRVGRRAYPRDVRHRVDETGFSLEGSHTGYRQLRGRPVHHRLFRWHHEGVLMVRDRVSGGQEVWIRSHIHMHPEVVVEQQSDRSVRLQRRDVTCTVTFDGTGRLLVDSGWYFPEFGRRHENKVLVFVARGSNLANGFCIASGEESPEFDLGSGARFNDKEYRW